VAPAFPTNPHTGEVAAALAIAPPPRRERVVLAVEPTPASELFPIAPEPAPTAESAAAPADTEPQLASGTGAGESDVSWPFPPIGSEVPYQPFEMIPKVSAGTAAPPDRVDTPSAWVLALLPALAAAAFLAIVGQLGDFYTRFTQGGVILVFLLLAIALAARDRRALAVAGHTATASPAWVLLTPLAYLIARAVRVRRGAGRAGFTALASAVLGAGLVAAALLVPGGTEVVAEILSPEELY
jgi:hypothetical protein